MKQESHDFSRGSVKETQGWSAEIAMNELKIKDKDRAIIAKMLQKK